MSATWSNLYIRSEPWSNLFRVSPSQFNVKCQLQKEEFLQLTIINSGNDCIAWKLKTNRPGRYMVSPKQGIILSRQQKDCTVVLAKLQQVPDTKKPDKFLIQATKIDPHTQLSDLPQLWKDRESKHNKKRGVYAYQSVTIKCFLHVDTNKSAESKKNSMIIENYVPSQPTIVHSSPKATAAIQSQSPPLPEVETPQEPPKPIDIDVAPFHTSETVPNKTEDAEQTKTTDSALANAVIPPSKPTKTDTVQYDPKTVEQWERKAQDYDELFQFTRKTLTQRDELKARWKAELEKTRSLQKLNRDMKEEKKRILNKYNKYRNMNLGNDGDEDEEYEDEDEEEKQESMTDTKEWGLAGRMTQQEKDERIQEMEAMDYKAVKYSTSGCTMSIIYVVLTIFLMYLSFIAGKHHANGISEINGPVMEDGTEKREM